MKRLYATTDPTEAELLRAYLRDEGIESMLDNEGGAAYAVGLPTGAVPLGINVSDQDAPAAAEALGRYFEKEMGPSERAPSEPAPRRFSGIILLALFTLCVVSAAVVLIFRTRG
jgi:hypothetical protein